MLRDIQNHLARDFLSSIVVFLVALPLCMGIAIASGAPAGAGILTGIIGGLVVGALSGCPLQVSGPAAGLSVIVLELVQSHGLATVGLIVLAAGVVQMAGAVLGLGQWFRAVPPSVLHGMLSGIGVLIVGSQFHVMLDGAPKGSGLTNLLAIPAAVSSLLHGDGTLPHREAALIGVITIGAILAWVAFAPKRLKIVPSPLVAVIVGATLAWALDFPIRRVVVPADLSALASWPALDWSLLLQPKILGAVLALAVIASAETLLTAVAVDAMQQHTPPTRFDRELFAQGLGNALCGFLGGLPMTGVIVRSKTNVDAGARSRTSAVLHGAWLLLAVALFAKLLALIPVASLAALLVYTGFKLVNPAQIREIKKHGPTELAIFVATVTGIVVTDLLSGVLLGLALSALKLFFLLTHLSVHAAPCEKSGEHHVTLDGFLTFLTLPRMASLLDRVPAGAGVQIRTDQVDYVDYACLEFLRTWQKRHKAGGGEVAIDWPRLERLYAEGLAAA